MHGNIRCSTHLMHRTIYFCGHFDSLATAKIFTEPGSSNLTKLSAGSERIVATFSFSETNITSRVGVSWISSAKACDFIDAEIPVGRSVDDLAAAAKDNWNIKVFSKIQTENVDHDDLGLLYSSLYGMHLMPSNRTGENPLWASAEPYYDDIVTFWDLFRCSTSLTQVLQPMAYEEQIRSLIDVWRHDGYLPDARSSNYNGRVQGGSNADNVLADAYVKGIRSVVDWADGYSAMVKDAEIQPPNNHDPQAPDSSDKEGRSALPDWLKYGYITPSYSRSVTRAIEYSANDFALYQVARGLGNNDDATKYLQRSRNWRNQWNANATALGFSGFGAPRSANGSFVQQDPLSCGGCYWGDDYYEALPWEYSLNPHHDMRTLIRFAGGPEKFISRLNTTFEPNQNPNGNPAFQNTIFNPSNEVSFTTPYLYHFAGRQDLSVLASRSIAKNYYRFSRAGLPGNSDSGAMQTWLLWNMIGLYPITGQTTFLIGSPWFGMTIDLGDGKTLKITTTGGNKDTAYQVQSLQVNGKDWNQNWLTWEDIFANGGTLDFVLGVERSGWSDQGALPPSPASEK